MAGLIPAPVLDAGWPRASVAVPLQPGVSSRRLGWLYVGLLMANLAAWGWAWLAFRLHPVLLGAALLAYVLGLRHAVDADHIAAIDNVTRALMQRGRRPLCVGLFFSLGHSTVVVLASAVLAAAAGRLTQRFASWASLGGVVGTSVSAAFLLVIAGMNIAVFASLFKASRRLPAERPSHADALEHMLAKGGLIARLLRPLIRLIGESWHMYPLGFLFGLGFDTASEVGLLGMSASQASHGLPVWSIMVFPALFTAGMALVDCTEGILMLGAYGWAFVKPARKLRYNMIVTGISVVVALTVGLVEMLSLVQARLGWSGAIWHTVADLNFGAGAIGCGVTALFGVCWAASFLAMRKPQ